MALPGNNVLILSNILFISAKAQTTQKIAGVFLKRYCKNILTAASAQEALELLQSKQIDIVICDIKLGDGCGIEMLQKAKRFNPDTIDILLMDNLTPELSKKATAIQPFGIFERPIKSSAFLNRIIEADREIAAKTTRRYMEKERILNEIFTNQNDNINEYLKQIEQPAAYFTQKGKLQAFNDLFSNLFTDATTLENSSITELLRDENAEPVTLEDLKNRLLESATIKDVPDSIYSIKIKPIEFGFNISYILYLDIKCDLVPKVQKPKILLVEDSPVARKIVKRELSPEANGYEYKEAKSAEEGLEILKHYLPCIIIADLVLPKMSGVSMIEKIKNDPELSDIPIIVMSELDNMEVNTKLIRLGVTSFVQKPFSKGALLHRIDAIRKESKPCLDVETKRVVNTLSLFENSSGTWQVLNSLCASLLHFFKSDDIDTAYGYYSLGLLAAAHHGESTLQNVLKLARSFKLGKEFLEFLEALKNPVSTTEQIFASVWKEFLESKGIESAEIKINNSTIKKQLDSFIERNRLQFNNGSAAQQIVYHYGAKLEELVEDMALRQEFIRLIETVLHHQLVHSHGGTCELHEELPSPRFLLTPKTSSPHAPEQLLETLRAQDFSKLQLTVETYEEQNALMVTAATHQPQKQQPEPEEPAFMDFSFEEEAAQQDPQSEKISATDFMEQTEIDPEDIESLEYMENDLYDCITELTYSDSQNEKLSEAGELFRKYGTTIIYLREFNTISQALTGLATQFMDTDLGNIDPALARMLPNILENLVNDLQNWRESIFVYHEADDIHFLDSSITNNCEQCKSFLTPKQAQEQNDADIFF